MAKCLIEPCATRDRLTDGMYLPQTEAEAMNDAVGVIELALAATLAAEPAEAKLRVAEKAKKVGSDETTALQGGRAKDARMNPLRSRTVEQSTLSSPLRIFAVADGDTANNERERLRHAQHVGTLTAAEAALVTRRYDLRDKVIRVDDFPPDFSQAAHS